MLRCTLNLYAYTARASLGVHSGWTHPAALLWPSGRVGSAQSTAHNVLLTVHHGRCPFQAQNNYHPPSQASMCTRTLREQRHTTCHCRPHINTTNTRAPWPATARLRRNILPLGAMTTALLRLPTSDWESSHVPADPKAHVRLSHAGGERRNQDGCVAYHASRGSWCTHPRQRRSCRRSLSIA